MRKPTHTTLFRWSVIPVLALILVHFAIYRKLPFQDGYVFPMEVFLIITGVGYLICESNVWAYRRLNGRIRLQEEPLKRAIFQMLAGLAVTTVVFTGLYLAINMGAYGLPFTWLPFLTYLLLMLGISLLENTVFLAYDFYHLLKAPAAIPADLTGQLAAGTAVVSPEFIWVERGQQSERVALSDIAYVFSKEGLVQLFTTGGQVITSQWSSLTDIQADLERAGFFRLNRQLLVHPQAVWSIREEVNRKIRVTLRPDPPNGFSEGVMVSRYKRNDFLAWLQTLRREKVVM